MFYIDVSHHDWNRNGGNLDWQRIKVEGGVDPVVCIRATYGDPQTYAPETKHFREMATAARAQGFHVGGYHNLIHSPDAAGIRRQVQFFKAELDAAGAEWAMLDIEPYEALKANGLWPRLTDVEQFIDVWKQLDGRPLFLYLARWVWAGILQSQQIDRLDGHLVSSRYPLGTGSGFVRDLYALIQAKAPNAGLEPYGGKTPVVWQFTSSAQVPGASSTTDVNFYPGTIDEFKHLTGRRVGRTMATRMLPYAQPSSSYVTPASQTFYNAVDALHAQIQGSGMYAFKKGFHSTRSQNQANWPGNYSYRAIQNQRGPSNKVAAYDFTFLDAKAGRFETIALFSRRLYDALHDPRMAGWFEFFGNIDSDRTVEGRNYFEKRDASSDSSHLWHIHMSESREMVEEWINKDAAWSVLAGESLQQWIDRIGFPQYGGVILKRGTRSASVYLFQRHALKISADGDFGPATEAALKAWQSRNGLAPDGVIGPGVWAKAQSLVGSGWSSIEGDDDMKMVHTLDPVRWMLVGNAYHDIPDQFTANALAKVTGNSVELTGDEWNVYRTILPKGGAVNVTLTDEQVTKVIDALVERVAARLESTDVEAVRSVLREELTKLKLSASL